MAPTVPTLFRVGKVYNTHLPDSINPPLHWGEGSPLGFPTVETWGARAPLLGAGGVDTYSCPPVYRPGRCTTHTFLAELIKHWGMLGWVNIGEGQCPLPASNLSQCLLIKNSKHCFPTRLCLEGFLLCPPLSHMGPSLLSNIYITFGQGSCKGW